MKWLSCVRLFAIPWIDQKSTRLLCPWDFPGKSTGVGCHFLLQGIFPTQESNPGPPHGRQTLYCLSHQGSPKPYFICVCVRVCMCVCVCVGCPWCLSGKESAYNAGPTGDSGLIPGLGRSPGGGKGNRFQYSCLENPMDREAWQDTV